MYILDTIVASTVSSHCSSDASLVVSEEARPPITQQQSADERLV